MDDTVTAIMIVCLFIAIICLALVAMDKLGDVWDWFTK